MTPADFFAALDELPKLTPADLTQQGMDPAMAGLFVDFLRIDIPKLVDADQEICVWRALKILAAMSRREGKP